MATPSEILTQFLASWGRTREELDRAFDVFFEPSTVWENVGMATTVGIQEAGVLMDQFEAMTGVATYATDIVNIAENGNLVLTERIDYFIDRSGVELSQMRLMGIFEVKGDKVIAWRDYFDSAANAALLEKNAR